MKLAVLAFTLVSLSVPAFAQKTGGTTKARRTAVMGDTRRPFTILPQIGVAMMDLEGVEDAETDEGLNLGVMLDFGPGPVKFQTGLSYIQAGAQADAPSDAGRVQITVKFDYIAIHAGAKYFTMKPSQGLFVKGSILPMVNTRHDAEITVAGQSRKMKVDDIRSMDIMFQAAVGYEVPTDNGIGLGVELSFNRGILDQNTGDGEDLFNEGFILSGLMRL
ncbi:MAG TPA: outer membrane beta-barrel protein [Bdellovibrionales bacterium]|nr:outer membrane beta-barrel protein [Bdellovibrionales bacterium]